MFAQNKVKFLGFQIHDRGLHVAPEKIVVINKIKKPSNLTELKSFLGILNYYAQFIKNYSSLATPLFALLKKNVYSKWSADCDVKFEAIKRVLT